MEENQEILYFIDRTSNPDPPVDFMNEPIEVLPLPTVVNVLINVSVPLPPTEPTPTTNKNDFSEIVKLIKRKLKNNCKEYHFRPYKIDGVYCYIVLYLKQRILTIESINIKCHFTEVHTLPYVLYHKKYKSIDKIVQLIHEITTTYKIINGDLLSKTDYNDVKTEEIIIPYNEDEVCCVCLEHTTDNTTCGHFICFSCRDKCIIQKKKDCPICRTKNVLPVYSNCMQLINNVDYFELNDLFHNRIYDRRYRNTVTNDDDDNSIISSSSSSSSSSEEEDEEEEEGQEEERQEVEGQEIEEQRIRNQLREVGLYDTDDSEST